MIIRFSMIAVAFLGCSIAASDVRAAPEQTAPPATLETHRVAENSARHATDPAAGKSGMGRWYAGLHVGAVIQPDMQLRGPALRVDALQDVGYVFDLVFGYKFNGGFRLDTELGYRNNDTNGIYAPGTKVKYGEGIGGADAFVAMLNGWYDFDFIRESASLLGNWVPYVGGGIGYSKVWIDPGYYGAITVIDSSDSSLVWQAGAGFIYHYTDDLQISLDYRYLRSIGELEFRYPAYTGTNDATYQTHSFMVGFRGFF